MKQQSYKFSLPVYYTQKFKTKKDKTFLVSMNWYRNAHYYIKNEVKIDFEKTITNMFNVFFPDAKISGAYGIKGTYYYKNSGSDLGNVTFILSKFINDALQVQNVVINDNVKYCKEECYKVGELDKENPRLEVELYEILE